MANVTGNTTTNSPRGVGSLIPIEISLWTGIEAILIVIGMIILGRILRKLIIRKSKETTLTWIINEDTADIVFRMFVLGGMIWALYVIGVMNYQIGSTSVGNIAFAVGFFYFAYLIAKKSKDYLIMSAGKKPSSDVQVKAKIFYYTFITIAFFLALSFAGISAELSALLAAAGITGIILGFSAQTVVANFISGIFMYFDKPLNIGDQVKIGELEGIVEDIRILSTRIRAWDGTLIRIPNEKLFNSNIINLQRYPARRVEIEIGIAYSADTEKAIEVIKKTLNEMPLVLAEPGPVVFVKELGDSAVVLSIRAWAPSERWFDVRTEAVSRIKKALDEAGIEIPFPQRVNWFANELRVKVDKES
ncbi:small-conductance mechanosensitive channel [Thermococcus onnurineus NA1]|uniref:Small-conductance mechanosensitive channel n=1 Tax=Thermococcus onnurineus (strain NA1) TaxID=523850 RepID=B6YW64_THEON|nr:MULTISPECIES: mechanosensitive ion channel family protein [Thermococcus]ACJ17430.1 small-conductance mechanosensitive channel [Thermococcus onnurineus NA1]NJE45834.1 mechanosensitive ion channel family protein [Thermococcus sp. GR7]NJE79204.1 mechanosensitive ion channel family protein [Thermococcus sp. GR4]NJF22028.1 mechanosensitive ion channel family protein [Thermococcus sp. GR5]